MSAGLMPVVRDLFGQQHPPVARLSAEQRAGLLWKLRYVPDEEDSPPEPFEVADVLEVLDVERGLVA